jgi:hypothetical protein
MATGSRLAEFDALEITKARPNRDPSGKREWLGRAVACLAPDNRPENAVGADRGRFTR